MKIDFKNILNQFDIAGPIKDYAPFGDGHINDTFLIKLENNAKAYVLQRINHFVFPNVDQLMTNIVRVTQHIKQKVLATGRHDVERRVLQYLPAKNGKYYYKDAYGSYWRLCYYIPDSHSFSIIPNAELAYQGGRAFGEFSFWLSDFPLSDLSEIIVGFHDLNFRLGQFLEVLRNDPKDRKRNALKETDKIQTRMEHMQNAFDEMSSQLPKRIIHADTKFNNVLFDKNNAPLCVVDLDTVMPGFIVSDFGDAIRTGTNTGQEDDTDLERVNMNRQYFEAYAKGFLEKTRAILTREEINSLAFGALLLTYMQAVRFLTDYLAGDEYYKIKYEQHNLQRTRAQLKLLEAMETSYSWMQEVVFKLAKQEKPHLSHAF